MPSGLAGSHCTPSRQIVGCEHKQHDESVLPQKNADFIPLIHPLRGTQSVIPSCNSPNRARPLRSLREAAPN
jgi:hypothetical protein